MNCAENNRKKKSTDKKSESLALQSPLQKFRYLYFLVPLVLTAVAFSGILNDSFLNWDDDVYVTGNPLVQSLSVGNLIRLFSPQALVSGCYQPITILSFAFDHALWGSRPQGFIAANILLHLLNVLLAFLFIKRLSGSELIASICALLFGIHPMHVESVAWISGRKDLLCTAFYLSALLQYLRYRERFGRERVLPYCLMLLLTLLALLSKSAAVTLPVVLLLLDYYGGRKFSAALIVEKLPLVALAALCGILAINGQKVEGALEEYRNLRFIARLATGAYGYLFYLVKFVLPIKMSAFYPYPPFLTGALKFPSYLLPASFLATAGLVFLHRKKVIIFGAAFFLINIVFILHFVPVGYVITADRFSYIPYLGLFFIVAWYGEKAFSSSRLPRSAFYIAGGLIALVLCLATYARTKVWENSITLWTDVVSTCPNPIASVNLGSALEENGEYPQALRSYDEAIRLDPENPFYYFNRGVLLTRHLAWARSQTPDTANLESGIADLEKMIGMNPARGMPDFKISLATIQIARSLTLLGRIDEASAFYRAAVERARSNPAMCSAIIEDMEKNVAHPELSVRIFREILEKDPISMEQLNAISDFLMRSGHEGDAIKTAEKALSMAQSSGQVQLAQDIGADISDMQESYNRRLSGRPPVRVRSL